MHGSVREYVLEGLPERQAAGNKGVAIQGPALPQSGRRMRIELKVGNVNILKLSERIWGEKMEH